MILLDDQLDRDDMLVPLRGFAEGEPTERAHRGVERNSALRAAALRVHGHGCMVCGFDFGRAYGARGVGFAEVHHLKPLASLRGKTVLTNPVHVEQSDLNLQRVEVPVGAPALKR